MKILQAYCEVCDRLTEQALSDLEEKEVYYCGACHCTEVLYK